MSFIFGSQSVESQAEMVRKVKSYKKGYTYRYRYYDGDKRKSIGSVSILKLRDMVKEKGLDWIVTDEEKANETLKKELNYG